MTSKSNNQNPSMHIHKYNSEYQDPQNSKSNNPKFKIHDSKPKNQDPPNAKLKLHVCKFQFEPPLMKRKRERERELILGVLNGIENRHSKSAPQKMAVVPPKGTPRTNSLKLCKPKAKTKNT